MSSSNSHSKLKRTPIGYVAADWTHSKVGRVCQIANNLRKPISQEERSKMQGDYPYYGPTGILDYIDEHRVSGKYVLIGEDGDHFLKFREKQMTLLVEGEFNVNNHAHLLSGTDQCCTEWIHLFFQHKPLTPYLTRQGAGRFKLSKAALVELPISYPPLPEQKKIAEILSCWDSAIETIEKLIDAKTRFKKGLMQHAFPDPRFLRTNEVRALKLLSKIKTGKKDVNEGNPLGKYPFYTCAAEPTRSDIYSFDTEAILIAGNGNIGTCHHVKGKFEAYQRTYVLTDFHEVEGRYLFHAIRRYLSREVARQTQVTAMPYIKVGLLQDLHIPMFDSSKREQIVNLLDTADLQIEGLLGKLHYIQMQKRGLMQQLLTGNIPVSTSESPIKSKQEEYALNA